MLIIAGLYQADLRLKFRPEQKWIVRLVALNMSRANVSGPKFSSIEKNWR
jgi:hypothetical protein